MTERTSKSPASSLAVLVRLSFWREVWEVWSAHNCASRAAALTFVTVLGLVPLTAIGVAVLEAVGQASTTALVTNFLSHYMVPVRSGEVASYVSAFAKNLRRGALGPIGIGLSVLTAFLLFHNVETAFNDLWRSPARRGIVRKFTVFWTLATIGPALLALSLVQGASVLRDFAIAGLLLPFAGVTVLLVLANRLLPRTWVPWRSALAAGILSSLIFESAKYLFAFYITKVAFSNYHTVYGKLAVLPILLVWIHFSWSAVLLGATVGRVLALPGSPRHVPPDWRVAVVVMVEVGRKYVSGGVALSEEELTQRIKVPFDVLSEVLLRLRRAGLLAKVSGDAEGYVPTRPLDRIRVSEIAEVMQHSAPPGIPGALEQFLRDVQSTLTRRLQEKTVAELVEAILEPRRPETSKQHASRTGQDDGHGASPPSRESRQHPGGAPGPGPHHGQHPGGAPGPHPDPHPEDGDNGGGKSHGVSGAAGTAGNETEHQAIS